MTVNVSQVEDQVGRSMHSGSEGSILHPWGYDCPLCQMARKPASPEGSGGGRALSGPGLGRPSSSASELEVSVLEKTVCGGYGEPHWRKTPAPGVWNQAMLRQRRILVCS